MIHFTFFNMILGLSFILGVGFGISRFFTERQTALENAVLRATLIITLLFPFLLGLASMEHWQTISVPIPTAIASFPNNSFNQKSSIPSAIVGEQSEAATQTAAQQATKAEYISDGWFVGYVIWILGACLFLLRLAYAQYLVFCWKNDAQSAEITDSKRIVILARRYGVTTPEVYVSRAVKGPIYCGILRPTILLPDSIEETSDEVLIHELSHHIRWDSYWLLCGEVVAAVIFFHPIIWLIVRRQTASAEEVCDDFVLSQQVDPYVYAVQLADQADRWKPSERFGIAISGMAAFKSSLGRRVQRILNTKRFLQARISIGGLMTVALCALFVLGLTVFVSYGQQSKVSITPNTVAPSKIDNDWPILSIIDRNGRKLSLDDLPTGVLTWVKDKWENTEIKFFHNNSPDGFAMVSAELVYPQNDTNLDPSTELVTPLWTCSRAIEHVSGCVFSALPIELGTSSCHFRAQMLGYKTVDVPVPKPLSATTLIWLGEIDLVPDDSPTQIVTGAIVGQTHNLINQSGMAYLRVNGTNSGLSTEV